MEEKKRGYVDIHSHILPGVDDGSMSMDESIRMLEIAYAQGIRRMYATPHHGSGKELCGLNKIKSIFAEVKEKALHIGNDGIELLLGNEIYYNEESVSMLNSGEALTMNGTKYVLVEFDYEIDFGKMYNSLEEMLFSGYRPILAHIERYSCLRNNITNINLLKNLCIYLQINTSSVIMKFSGTSSFCRKLIKEGYITFLGSDCHGYTGRPPCMKDGVDILSKKVNAALLDKILFDNTDKLYNDQFI